MKMIATTAGILLTLLPVQAQSAETWILQRERTEAVRYSQQVHSQAKAIAALDRQAERLAEQAEKAYTAAVKREIAMSQVLRAEQAAADKSVHIAEYGVTQYDIDTSNIAVGAKMKGVGHE